MGFEDLIREIRRLRQSIEAGNRQPDFTNIQNIGANLNLDVSGVIAELTQLASIDVDLSGLLAQIQQLEAASIGGRIDRSTFNQERERLTGLAGNLNVDVTDTFDEIERGSQFAGESFQDLAQRVFFFREALGTIGSAVQAFISPLRQAVNAAEAFNQTALQTQILFAANTRSFNAAGEEIFSFTERIKGSQDEFIELNKRLEIATQSVAGLTTARLNNVAAQVAQSINQVQGQSQQFVGDLEVIEALVPSISSALSTLQIPEFQDAQELRALLSGDFNNPDALLAQRLGITRAEGEIARAEGRFVDLLLERLKPFEEGNKLAAQSLTNVLSNFQDISERLSRSLGAGLLEPIANEANKVFGELATGTEALDLTERVQSVRGYQAALKSVTDIQQQIDEGIGTLTENQVEALERSRDAFREQADLIKEGVDFDIDSTNIEDLEEQLANAPQSLVDNVDEFFITFGQRLGTLLDELFTSTRELISLLNNVGVTDAIQSSAEFAEGLVSATTGVLKGINAGLEVTNNLLEKANSLTTGFADGLQGVLELQTQELGRTGDVLEATGDAAIRIPGTLFKVAALNKSASLFDRIGRALGAISRLPIISSITSVTSSLSKIPLIGGGLTKVVSQFGLLGKLLPGVGQALLAFDAFKFSFDFTRAITGAKGAEEELVQISGNIADGFTSEVDTILEKYSGLGELVGDELNVAANRIRNTREAIQEEIARLSEPQEELGGRSFIESIVNKEARKEAEDNLAQLQEALEELDKQAITTGVNLERTAAKAIAPQGTLGANFANKLNNDFIKLRDNIDEIGSAELSKFFTTFIQNLEQGVEAGAISASEAVEKLLELDEQDKIPLSERQQILGKIVALRDKELQLTNSLVDFETQIAKLKIESGELTGSESRALEANLRLQKATNSVLANRQKLADINRLAEQEQIDPQERLKVQGELNKALAEEQAARANIATVQAQSDFDAAQRAIDSRLTSQRELLALNKAQTLESQELIKASIQNTELEKLDLELSQQKLRNLEEQLANTRDSSKIKDIEVQIEKQGLEIAQRRVALVEKEIAAQESLIQARIREQKILSTDSQAQDVALTIGGLVSNEELAVRNANREAQEALLELTIRTNAEIQDTEKILQSELRLFQAVKAEEEARLALASKRSSLLELELRRQGFSRAEIELRLQEQNTKLAEDRLAAQRESFDFLESVGIPVNRQNEDVLSNQLDIINSQRKELEAFVRLREDETSNITRANRELSKTLSLQDSLLGKIEAATRQRGQNRLEGLSQTASQLDRLEDENITLAERGQILRELSRVSSNAAALAGAGKLEGARKELEDSINQERLKVQNEEERIANVRLDVEQKIAQLRNASAQAELEAERARALQIEDSTTREAVLTSLDTQEQLLGLESRLLSQDPSELNIDDFRPLTKVAEIPQVQTEQTEVFKSLLNEVKGLKDIINNIEIEPQVNLNIAGANRDPLIENKLLRGL